MKKYLCLFGAAIAFGCATVTGTARAVASADELDVTCKAAYLCDCDSGTKVYAKNETKRLPIASMCKIMTLLLSFEAVDEGCISYDEQITIGENASGMGGSQVFLQTNLSYSAAELMKTVAVCSANDSCVALAERIAGTESAFVDKMNKRAKELGADNTLFANCTGLPKEPQYSCAKDVSVMLRELLKHQKYFEFSKIWLEDFAHPDGRTTRITNTNKLIRFYEGCDGGKTGYTSEAGFCLAATAKRGDTRLVSVVIGSDQSQKRFSESKAMLNYAFNCYENKKILEAGKAIERKLPVKGSKISEVDICAEKNLSAFVRKGEAGGLSVDYQIPDEAKAPIAKGDCVGEAHLFRDGIEIARTRLICMQSVDRLSWWEAMREGARNWN